MSPQQKGRAASDGQSQRPAHNKSGLKKRHFDGAPRTLGPVSDLERHLPPEWWSTLFNAIYLQTDGDVVEDQLITQQEVDLVVELCGLEKSDRVLDLCCGQGRHAIELATRGFEHVTGVDRSRFLIRLARRRARRASLSVRFREGDARRFRHVESSFDTVIMMGNSFGYFESADDDAQVLLAVRRALRSGGTLFLDLADGDWLRHHFEDRSWEWIDAQRFVCRERKLSEDKGRLISREVVVDAEQGVLADQFYAERLYSREAIAALLERCGYLNVRLHGDYATQSERNQDLGMMARRLLVTAQAPKKAARPKVTPVPFPKVTVLLGDPSLPDPVKRDGRFNPEDLETIHKLREALEPLSAYTFQLIAQHATLLQSLRSNPPDFVLNFCDEGYQNNPHRELHVPALLELLDIPYTGASPACLGLCYDKSIVRAVAMALDVPVPLETYVAADDFAGTVASVMPALLKPAQGDGSMGITEQAVVFSPGQALDYLAYLREILPGRPVLVQEFLPGAEYSVGIVGNIGIGFTVLPVLEVDYSALPPELPRLLSYASKWQPESPYWTHIKYRQARVAEEAHRLLTDYSLRLFERLDCRDYARFDFRTAANGEIKLLDVNPNPGWCWDGKLNLMASFDGLSYTDLLRMIIETAQARLSAHRR